MNYFLKSPRLGFRCWSEDDLPLALGLWGDDEVSRLIGGPFTPAMVRDRLTKEIAQMREFGLQYWPIFLRDRNQSHQHIGCAGLRPYRRERRIHESGVHLRGAFHGQGLGKEAALAVIAHAFDALHAEALFAGHHPANAASRRLLSSPGIVLTHEELYRPTGLMHPSYLLRGKQAPVS